MKILYIVILISGLTQLITTEIADLDEYTLNLSFTEVNEIAGHACLQLKNISDRILEDEFINKSSSVLMLELKKNLTKWQEIYPFYLRFGHNETLLITISNIFKRFQPAASSSGDRDYLHVKQLLRIFNLNAVWQVYKKQYKEVVVKLENLETYENGDKLFKNWVNHLKECRKYECYLLSRQKHLYTIKEQFVGFLQKELSDLTISFVNNATVFIKRVLSDPKLTQLRPFLRDNLKETMKEKLYMIDLSDNIFQLFFLPLSLDMTLSYYAEMEEISLEEVRAVVQILNNHGYEKVLADYRASYVDFLQHDLLKEYERLKVFLSPKELMSENDFWATFDKLKETIKLEEKLDILINISKKHFQSVCF